MPAVDYVGLFKEVPMFKRIKGILQQDGHLMRHATRDLDPAQVAVIEATAVHGSLVLRLHTVPDFKEQIVTNEVPESNGRFYYKLSKSKAPSVDQSLMAIKSPINESNLASYQRYLIVIIRDCLELEPEHL